VLALATWLACSQEPGQAQALARGWVWELAQVQQVLAPELV
jgi:hypothetical protein